MHNIIQLSKRIYYTYLFPGRLTIIEKIKLWSDSIIHNISLPFFFVFFEKHGGITMGGGWGEQRTGRAKLLLYLFWHRFLGKHSKIYKTNLITCKTPDVYKLAREIKVF